MTNFRDGYLQQGQALGALSEVYSVNQTSYQLNIGQNQLAYIHTAATATSTGAISYTSPLLTVVSANHGLIPGSIISITSASNFTSPSFLVSIIVQVNTTPDANTFTFYQNQNPAPLAGAVISYVNTTSRSLFIPSWGLVDGQQITLVGASNGAFSLDQTKFTAQLNGNWYGGLNNALVLSYDQQTNSFIEISRKVHVNDRVSAGALVAAAGIGTENQVLRVVNATPTWSADAVGSLADGNILVEETTGIISQAQLLDLFNTPVKLIDAPGAGLYHIVDEVEFFHDYAVAVYAAGGILQIQYDSGTDILSAPASIVTGGADSYLYGRPDVYGLDPSLGTGGLSLDAAINHAVQITNLVALFINGDVGNVLKYRVRYHTVTAQV